jgi:hypothetical protein
LQLIDGVKPSERQDYGSPAIAVDLYPNFENMSHRTVSAKAVHHAKVMSVTHRTLSETSTRLTSELLRDPALSTAAVSGRFRISASSSER